MRCARCASARTRVWSERKRGFLQDMRHFVDCVAKDAKPLVAGEDGKAVLCGRERPPVIFAAYESAVTGQHAQTRQILG